MSLDLTRIGYSRCSDFLLIKDYQASVEPGKDKDLFIGKKVNQVLVIKNGETLEFRDVVVYGKLTIKSAQVNNTSTYGTLVARNVLTAGEFVCCLQDDRSERKDRVLGNVCIVNAKLKCDHHYHAKNVSTLVKTMEGVVEFWHEYQRETARKLGLKSILI